MASLRDLSGNTPEADRDQSGSGHYDLQAVVFKGTQHNITIGAVAVATPILSRQCRAVRIAPLDDCHWEIGAGVVASATSPHLPGNAVEIVPIVELNSVVSLIQEGAVTGPVTVTEDRS